MGARKPLILLAVLGLLAIGLFVFGAAGAGRGVAAGGWPQWPSPNPSSGDHLTADDLRGSSTCTLEGATISFVGGCVVEVQQVTEGFPWQRVTRRAMLTAGPQPVGLTVTLAGKTLHTTLDPGEGVRLTYTREGGTFALACASLTPCSVLLAKDA